MAASAPPPPTIPVLHATDADFDAKVLAPRDELVVVYFWGPHCPNCEVFAARLPELLAALGEAPARLVKVNAYDETQVATRHGIYGIPAFHLFRDGRKLGRMSEFRGDAFWLGVVRDHLPERETEP